MKVRKGCFISGAAGIRGSSKENDGLKGRYIINFLSLVVNDAKL